MSKRRRSDLDSLRINSRELKYLPMSQKRHYYANRQPAWKPPTKARRPPQRPQRTATPLIIAPEREPAVSSLSSVAKGLLRSAIKDIFTRVLGSPPESIWTESGTIPEIIKRLAIPRGSWGTVRKVCREVLADPDADVSAEKPGVE